MAWLQRVLNKWPSTIWLNPVKAKYWGHTQSIGIMRQILAERMYPLTLRGLETATRELSRRH